MTPPTTYLNTDEVDSALRGLASEYSHLTELIVLPHRTVEGRVCHALRIGRRASSDVVMFTACAHAREWGGADASVYFAADLLRAYDQAAGVRYGNSWFPPESIWAIVERLNVVVFPCVNPDGRAYDQRNPRVGWRKNRNLASMDGDPNSVGVDINRNHPFLWDSDRAFDFAARRWGTLGSKQPRSEKFRGTSPASEPETRNIHWLLDAHRFTRWFVDIHSFDGCVLYPWGDDSNQTASPSMNFLNRDYDGQRGVVGGYGEHISSVDITIAKGTAQRLAHAMNRVRGSRYVAKQSISLEGEPDGITYPTSGTAADYAFSRHFVDCSKSKIHGFTLEFGFKDESFASSFHPPWPEMKELVKEVDAAMMELCVAATPASFPPWRAAWRWLFPWQIWDPMVRQLGKLLRRIITFVSIHRLPVWHSLRRLFG